MRTKYYIALLVTVIAAASCQHSKVEQQASSLDSIQAQTKVSNGVIHIPGITRTDTIKVGSRTYQYTFHREAQDSLGIVEDDMGTRYADNFYQLTILRDGGNFFKRRFTKADFRSLLGADFRQNGIFDGFRYSHSDDGKLFFSACISYPESDMSAPFFVVIGPDGSYTVQQDNTSDMPDEIDGV